jgi:hypothetical protein
MRMQIATPFIAVIGLLGIQASARAEVLGTFGPLTVEVLRTATECCSPRFTTHFVSVQSEVPIQGFDFFGAGGSSISDPEVFGFFGSLRQVHPAGQPTVFADYNDIGEEAYKYDSQFTFLAHTLPKRVIVSEAFESSSSLQAAFSFSEPRMGSFRVARLVMPSGATFQFRGRVDFAPQTGQDSIVIAFVPEPQSWALAALASIIGFANSRRSIAH